MISEIDNAIRTAIQAVAVGPERGRDLDFAHAQLLMQGILEHELDPVQVAVVLIALRMKRESEQEMRGFTQAAQLCITPQRVNTPNLITLVDPFDGYSRTLTLSAFVPAVLAACGYSVVMHGVASVGPKFGVTARQVLEGHAGFQVHPMRVAQDIETHGWSYIDQADYLPQLHRLIALRNRIIKRTAITTFERVLAPVRSTGENHLAIGYVHRAYPEIYAAIAQQAGYDFIHLHKGIEGGLMIASHKPFARYHASLSQPTIELHKSAHSADSNDPAPLASDPRQAMPAQAASCYQHGVSVLNGQVSPCRHALLAASANIMASVDPVLDFPSAVEKAREQIDNGRALNCFTAVVAQRSA